MGFHSGGSSKQEVKQLEKFQRKHAAIETIFTLALLYIAGLQVWTTVHQELNLVYALTPVFVLAVVALILGGRNLLEQLYPDIPTDE